MTDTPLSRPRLESIDLLRGFVMALMLLDHTRDYFTVGDPEILASTTPAFFFTRWITHLCAPVFIFLAGTAAYLRGTRGHSKADMSRFLLIRGFWLIFLEFTVVRLAMSSDVNWRSVGVGQVIWVIGASMVCMAGLIHLPRWGVAVFGVGLCLLHNLLDDVRFREGFMALVWRVLHRPGPVDLGPTDAFVLYPLIPWPGVMAAGYAFGGVFAWEPKWRTRFLLLLGGAMLLAFVALRWSNAYGDPEPWSAQADSTRTMLSFFRVEKYPPSLLYLLATLGIGLPLLALFENSPRLPLRRFLRTLGQVPLFFYVLQWLCARLLSAIAGLLTGQKMPRLGQGSREIPPPEGLPLWTTYAAWLLGLALLYPLCRWFAGLRQRRRDWWLSYL